MERNQKYLHVFSVYKTLKFSNLFLSLYILRKEFQFSLFHASLIFTIIAILWKFCVQFTTIFSKFILCLYVAILLQGEEINGKIKQELELDVDNDLVSFYFIFY